MNRLRSTRWAAVLGALWALAACRTLRPLPDEPAVLANPTPQSREELARAVGTALGSPRVLLADDALTRESTLIIEHARPRDRQGIPIDGRVRREPERFQLVRAGAQCVLVHERTARRFPLEEATCGPVPPTRGAAPSPSPAVPSPAGGP